MQVTEPYAEWNRDQDCHADRRKRDLQVRERLVAKQAEVVEEEAECVEECVHL